MLLKVLGQLTHAANLVNNRCPASKDDRGMLVKATLGRDGNLLEYFSIVTHNWILSEVEISVDLNHVTSVVSDQVVVSELTESGGRGYAAFLRTA